MLRISGLKCCLSIFEIFQRCLWLNLKFFLLLIESLILPTRAIKFVPSTRSNTFQEDHQIDLACLADDPNDMKNNTNLERYCRHSHVEPLNKTWAKIKGFFHLLKGGSISVGYFYNQQIQNVVDQWLSENTYDAIFCFSSPMAEYIFRSKLPAPRSPSNAPCSTLSAPLSILQAPRPTLIMDFCDLDSDKWRQYARRSRLPLNLIYKLESKRLLAYEQKINQIFDHSLFVSQQEADLFSHAFPSAKNLTVIPNGVDHRYFSPDYSEDSRIQGFEGSRETNEMKQSDSTNPTNSTNQTNSTNPTNQPIKPTNQLFYSPVPWTTMPTSMG